MNIYYDESEEDFIIQKPRQLLVILRARKSYPSYEWLYTCGYVTRLKRVKDEGS
jgi:hypothetical protein